MKANIKEQADITDHYKVMWDITQHPASYLSHSHHPLSCPFTYDPQEFVSGVSANVAITNAVKAGNDDGDIMQRLRDYLKDHAT